MMERKIVLAIDDNPADLNTLQGILASKYIFQKARSASGALASLNSSRADVILLDVEVPNISGFEFLRDIRKIPSYMNIPVIIVSSKTGKDFFDAAKNSSAFDILSKPVMPERLIQTIEKAIDASAA